jgi:hypothetical protein
MSSVDRPDISRRRCGGGNHRNSRGLQFWGFGAARPFDLLCRGVARASGKKTARDPSGHDLQQFAATPQRFRHDFLPTPYPEPYHFRRPVVALVPQSLPSVALAAWSTPTLWFAWQMLAFHA